ncbi:MAG: hypothetical protein E5X51_23455 [Mesorhizobium sp.]|uniref:hypothetical protein n=1 Tax=Mesorhizobium sp. TaxID=1871066 RepID=UPI0012281C5D|nr:hypothetical protein [Mesorhizobium sp.]TIQ18882.1 MAG: hypothetical protein E5X51_23455 [Mesorhizobium sp.]
MTTRILYLNKDAPSPAGLPTSAEFRLVSPGGIRLNADNVIIDTGKIDRFVNLVDGVTYGTNNNNNNQEVATVVNVNGVNVAQFDPTLATVPTGYTMQNFGFAGLNTHQYAFAALWKVTDAFAGGKPREIISTASSSASSQRATLREDASGVLQARAQRTTADANTIVSINAPVRMGGWASAAAVFDFANNLVTIHDLLGTESVSGAIAGTPGAAPTDVAAYRLGYLNLLAESFVGQMADYVHLPYAPTGPRLLALRMHMQARAADLAS